jgi:NSS family neurotransmitter:Na+ symporter
MTKMKRDNFGSKLGILAAAAGSAIGLGNIWKFPYITGKNGGAAFILVYLVCIALIGLPVMISEFVLGRKTQANAVGSFKKIEPKKPWFLSGYLATLTAFIILSYYAMIAGWILSYIGRAATGKIVSVAPANLGAYFEGIIGNSTESIICTFVVIVLTALVVISGIKNGVEKYCKILMPVLFGILILLMFRSLTLDGASKGVEFLFKPDFSQLTTKGVLEALGHSFFTLSLGMGIILTYGSYIDRKEDIVKLAIQVTIADTVIALMAGLVIFPAVFAYGLEPTKGAGLIFVTLPAVFSEMPFGNIFGFLFFSLIGIAAITSTISLLEVVVSFAIEEFGLKRKKATILVSSAIFLVSLLSIMSFGPWSNVTIFGKTFFGLFDFITSNIFLPIGGLLISIFVGWVWGTENTIREITSQGLYKLRAKGLYSFIIKFLAPAAIFLILLNSTGLLNKLLGSN